MTSELGRLARALASVLGAALLLPMGCAGGDEALRSDLARLDQRVAELERSSGRWQAQVDGLEEDVLLLEDRVEAHRLSLERRGMMAARATNELPAYRPPSAEPDYAYLAELPVERLSPDAAPTEGVEEEDHAELEELVITNATLQRFVEENGGVPHTATADRTYEPVVVGERLPVMPPEPLRPETPTQVASGREEEGLELYQSSLEEFNAGNYETALSGFEAFLATEPLVDYQDNAHYWIGECHYARGAYDAALVSFQRVVRDYPDGNKVPDSLLKIGLTYERLNEREEASQILAALVDAYPLTDAARRASERLADLN